MLDKKLDLLLYNVKVHAFTRYTTYKLHINQYCMVVICSKFIYDAKHVTFDINLAASACTVQSGFRDIKEKSPIHKKVLDCLVSLTSLYLQ